MELNPNHPVTQAMHDQWHVIAAILVIKYGEDGDHIVITDEDIKAMQQNSFVVIQELRDGVHLRLVDSETGHRLAREHGGLPS